MDGETQEWDFSGAALVLPAGLRTSPHHLLNEPLREFRVRKEKKELRGWAREGKFP